MNLAIIEDADLHRTSTASKDTYGLDVSYLLSQQVISNHNKKNKYCLSDLSELKLSYIYKLMLAII